MFRSDYNTTFFIFLVVAIVVVTSPFLTTSYCVICHVFSCKELRYPESDFSTVSVVIVHYQEQISVVLRTIFAVLLRTPFSLLHEIILVDDCSDPPLSLSSVRAVLPHEWMQKVQPVVRLKRRAGLIGARLAGARRAQAEILVFLDAHVEVNVDWLPPLLQPILRNPQTCTTPVIDTIRYDDFAYIAATPSRGGFNWQFNYVQLPLRSVEQRRLPLPHRNPVMSGGLFAIRQDFFWQLGGYDDGLQIWGGEQFELSFKIWMCGGLLLEVPCSRVGHLYRSPNFHVNYTDRHDDYVSRVNLLLTSFY